jgi:tRNA (cmo5U34)-methyltransferase
MGTVTDAFDAVASEYDAGRRRLIPCFDMFYGTAVDLAVTRLSGLPSPRLLDLGAGTGLLAGLIAAAVPGLRVTATDGAPAMLEVAARRLAGTTAEFVVADLLDLPAGPYDAIVSALAIHHLDDAGKRELYRRVYAALGPGGIFVNAEQVAGPTPALNARYHQVWLAGCVEAGASAEDLAAAAVRMAYDQPSTVDEQCAWLREAGFTDVDCFAKHWRFAVLGGTRAV